MLQNRIILIDKPTHMTSFGVVARVRRQLSEDTGKKVKVGHCGTLDPFASGLLILVTGKQTKNAGEFMKKDKVYEATICLGWVSSTGDPEGEITEYIPQQGSSSVKGSTLNRVNNVLKQFVGEIEQTPPMFSAIKINGQRAYKLARKGEVVEIPKRTVTIYSLELLDYSYPELRIRTHVSSGTYIRSLAIDIGEALGMGAYCRELRRTKIADWDVADATSEFVIE